MIINDWKTHRKKLLEKPNIRKAFDKHRFEYEIARALIKVRVERSLTQKELAIRLHTKQSVISRVENAKTIPSLSFLKRVSEVLDVPLRLQFG